MQVKLWVLKLIATHYMDKLKLIILEDGGWSQKAGNKLDLLWRQEIGYKQS